MDYQDAMTAADSSNYAERIDAGLVLAQHSDDASRAKLRQLLANDPDTGVAEELARALVLSHVRHVVEDRFAAVATAGTWETRDYLVTEITTAHWREDVDLTETVLELSSSADDRVAAGAREIGRALGIEGPS